MVRVRLPERYRLKVIAFYTDEQKRIRPITAKKEQVQELRERKEEIRQKIEEAAELRRQLEEEAGKLEREIREVRPPRRRKLEIDPLVRDKYYEWVRYSRRWRNRKMLPIGGLQKYYESRKAAFVAKGGKPDAFDDAFDKLDMAQAVDSWVDLDKELAKYLVFRHEKEERPSQREIERMIREHEEEDRRIEELYRQYLEDLKEREGKHEVG